MNRRRFLRFGAVGVLAATAGCTTTVFGTNQGRVVGKTVHSGGTRLLTVDPSGVSAVDEYPGTNGNGTVSVDETVAKRLSKSFGTLTYDVTIEGYQVAWPNDAKEGERKRYTTSRAMFNQLQVGDSITFQPHPTNTDRISSVSCIAPDRESLSTRCSTGDGDENDDSSPI